MSRSAPNQSAPQDPVESGPHGSGPDPSDRGFWSEAWRRLKRDRLAMTGGVVVVIFFALAVFAPFLANDLPVYASFTNRHDYVRDFPGWKINHADLTADIGMLQAGRGDPAKVRARIALGLERAATKLGQLAESLDGAPRTQAEQLTAVYDAASSDPVASAGQLKEVGAATLAALDPGSVQLARQTRFPIFRQLSPGDVLFVFLFLSCVAAAVRLWRPVFTAVARRVQDPFKLSFAQAGVIVAPALVGALTWALLVPSQSDQVPYRTYAADAENTVVFTLIPYHPERGDSLPDQSPGTAPAEGASSHWLGTQEHGYDVLSGMVWGARVSLSVGFVAVSIYVLIGILLGALAGYFGGWTDHAISRVIEVVLCFPTLFLIITIMAYFPPSIFAVMLVIGFTGWPRIARLVRAEFLRLGGNDFVVAARALGMSPFRVIFRHILPNALAPVLVAAAFGIAGAILTESALSYLGIGVPPGTPSWGTLLKSAQRSPQDYWWLTLFPGFAIFIAVTAYNLLAEGLRDATDPRLRT